MTQCSERARGRRLDGWLLALGLPLAWLLAGAHLWRAGEGGALLFCIIGGLTVFSRSGERFRIRSFKNAEKAKTSENSTFRTVAANVSGDETDYKKLARRLKLQF